MLPDREVPWWAVALLDVPTKSDPSRVRHLAQRGYLNKVKAGVETSRIWDELVAKACRLADAHDIEHWIRTAPELVRFAALESPRAFVDFAGIRDDTLRIPYLADFHVRAVRYMREQPESLILLPFAHGKSWLSSMLVPFMDWAEEPEFTQGRVYYNKSFADNYTKKLMAEIERNAQLQALFPWIRRPIKPNPLRGISGDPCHAIWSTRGFSIGGKQAVEPSFEPLTVSAGVTGRRYWRAVMDDWVNSDNAGSQAIQDKMWNYYNTGPKTFKRVIPHWRSHHGTRAGTISAIGTLFHRQDINYRLMQQYRSERKPVMRVDVYLDAAKSQVIWPEERPLELIQELEISLGPVAFNMRCRNRIQESDEVSFPEEKVDAAVERGSIWEYGVAPPNCPILIGFDPASGKRTRYSKYPAAVVLAFNGDDIHVVEWGRWSYPQPRQVDQLAEWAAKFNSPVAIEDASQQISYKYWMEQRYPDVRVISHTTTDNKRDWQQGVESFIPHFSGGSIIIHSRRATPQQIAMLREELISYPQGRYTDLVMAMWVAKYQYVLGQSRFSGRFEQERPDYIQRRGLGTVIDLRALRERNYGHVS